MTDFQCGKLTVDGSAVGFAEIRLRDGRRTDFRVPPDGKGFPVEVEVRLEYSGESLRALNIRVRNRRTGKSSGLRLPWSSVEEFEYSHASVPGKIFGGEMGWPGRAAHIQEAAGRAVATTVW